MGLFDIFKNKDSGVTPPGNATSNVTPQQRQVSQGSEATATPIETGKQLRVKFGTREPLPFVDAESGLQVELRGYGSVTFTVAQTAPYRSEEQAMAAAQELCIQELSDQLAHWSGKIKVTDYAKIREEFMMAARARLKENGLLGLCSLDGVNLTEESNRKLVEAQRQRIMEQNPAAKTVMMIEELAAAQGSKDQEPVTAPLSGAEAPASSSMRPKFCPNCGTPAGEDKFCRNCGNKF